MKYYIAVFALIYLTSCNNSTKNTELTQANFNAIKWVEGKWEQEFEDGKLCESWKIQDDSTYTGISTFTADKETTFSEKMSIEKRGNDIFYVASVSDQNEGKPIPFKLAEVKGNEFIFENKGHDFPQRIVYSKKDATTLFAYIQGTQNGKEEKQEFEMKRIN